MRSCPQKQLLQQHQGALQHVQAQHAALSRVRGLLQRSPSKMQHLQGESVSTKLCGSHLWELNRQPVYQRQVGSAAPGGSLCSQADRAAVSQVWLQPRNWGWQARPVKGGGHAAQ